MAEEIPFNRSAPAPAGVLEEISPLLRRIVAPNPGPMTFTGTCTYVVGHGAVTLVDPGPDDATHLETLLAALQGETIESILVTHTHRDHSPLAARLKALTGAPVIGAAPHRTARDLVEGEYVRLDAGADYDYAPDRVLADGAVHQGRGYTLEAIETPGHTANHLAFALKEENALLSGDHVMAWSTTTVAPPDGAMGDYMASIQKLLAREERVFWPGHGGPVTEPQRFMRALQSHRRQREASILDRLGTGEATIPEVVADVYLGLNPALVKAAAMNVFAHLEDLVARGLAATDGPPRLDSRFKRS
jgi:glyoxylase-like metal-dependent hydrolase (beta-lactamase superfamily II)